MLDVALLLAAVSTVSAGGMGVGPKPGSLAFEDRFEVYSDGSLAGQGGWQGEAEVLAAPSASFGVKSLGLVVSGTSISRTVPAFYGVLAFDLFVAPSLTMEDTCTIDLGALGRVDARVRFSAQGVVSVLQDAAEGPVWVVVGTWDPADPVRVEVNVSGGDALAVSVAGIELFAGTTLAAPDKGSSLPVEFLSFTKEGGATVYIDNLTAVRTTCAADFEGDGVVGVRDLSILLSVWESPTLSFADLTADGRTNAADLATLFAMWGTCQVP